MIIADTIIALTSLAEPHLEQWGDHPQLWLSTGHGRAGTGGHNDTELGPEVVLSTSITVEDIEGMSRRRRRKRDPNLQSKLTTISNEEEERSEVLLSYRGDH